MVYISWRTLKFHVVLLSSTPSANPDAALQFAMIVMYSRRHEKHCYGAYIIMNKDSVHGWLTLVFCYIFPKFTIFQDSFTPLDGKRKTLRYTDQVGPSLQQNITTGQPRLTHRIIRQSSRDIYVSKYSSWPHTKVRKCNLSRENKVLMRLNAFLRNV